jgi:leader peptidase (prepilin peptidase)/N-methyltransferase
MMIPDAAFILYIIFIFAIGLAAGSFANVCIYRMPRDESVSVPRSHCPACNRTIAWYDNIPVLSFILLGGKCRHCGARISYQYPLIELLTGILFVLVALRFPVGPLVAAYLCMTFILVVVTVIDYYHQIIPDEFSYALIVLGILSSVFNASLGGNWLSRLLLSLAGIVVGGGILLFFGYLGKLVFHQEAMGGGDVKQLAGIGALLGWQKALSTLVLASILGSAVGLSLIFTKRMQRRDYLPFGPFLAAAAYASLFLPEPALLLRYLYR